MPAQIKPKSFESRRNSSFFLLFYWGGCASCLRACLGARLLPQSYQYPSLSEGADRVGGQLRGDKECPFSGVTKYGGVWRKEPESSARSVGRQQCDTSELSPGRPVDTRQWVGVACLADRTAQVPQSMLGLAPGTPPPWGHTSGTL